MRDFCFFFQRTIINIGLISRDTLSIYEDDCSEVIITKKEQIQHIHMYEKNLK